jgi:hypothetical protein
LAPNAKSPDLMDVAAAEVLRQRLAQQEQWRQARSVRVGSQPPFDPDGHSLESFRAGIRFYWTEQRTEVNAGRTELVTQRVCKRLVDGAWENDVIVEQVRRVA